MAVSHAAGLFSKRHKLRNSKGFPVKEATILRNMLRDAPPGWVAVHITSSSGDDVPGEASNVPILNETDLSRIEKALGRAGRKFFRGDQTAREVDVSYRDSSSFSPGFLESVLSDLREQVPEAKYWYSFWWVDPSQAAKDLESDSRDALDNFLEETLKAGRLPNYTQIAKAWNLPKSKLYKSTSKARKRMGIQKKRPETKESIARDLLARGLSYQDVEIELEQRGLSVKRGNLRRLRAELRKRK